MIFNAILEMVKAMLAAAAMVVVFFDRVAEVATAARRTISDCIEIIYSYTNYSWHPWNMVVLTPPIKWSNLNFDEIKIAAAMTST